MLPASNDTRSGEQWKTAALRKKWKAICFRTSLKHLWVNRIEISALLLSTEKNILCAGYKLPFLAGFGFRDTWDRDKSHCLREHLQNYSLTIAAVTQTWSSPALSLPYYLVSLSMLYLLLCLYPIIWIVYAWREADWCIRVKYCYCFPLLLILSLVWNSPRSCAD